MIAYEKWLIEMAYQLQISDESAAETLAKMLISHCINGSHSAYDLVEKYAGKSTNWTTETFYAAAENLLTQNQESCKQNV